MFVLVEVAWVILASIGSYISFRVIRIARRDRFALTAFQVNGAAMESASFTIESETRRFVQWLLFLALGILAIVTPEDNDNDEMSLLGWFFVIDLYAYHLILLWNTYAAFRHHRKLIGMVGPWDGTDRRLQP